MCCREGFRTTLSLGTCEPGVQPPCEACCGFNIPGMASTMSEDEIPRLGKPTFRGGISGSKIPRCRIQAVDVIECCWRSP